MWNAILGTWVFIAVLAWIGATFLQAFRFLRNLTDKLVNREPDSVAVTMQQMYGDVHMHEGEYAGTRNAHQRMDRRLP